METTELPNTPEKRLGLKIITDVVADAKDLGYPVEAVTALDKIYHFTVSALSSFADSGRPYGGRGLFTSLTTPDGTFPIYEKGGNFQNIVSDRYNTPQDVMFDRNRVLGCLSIDEALREYASFLVLNGYILHTYQDQNGFNPMDYVFPIMVTQHDGLSEKINRIFSQAEQEIKDRYSGKYGTIVEVVPVTERYSEDIEPRSHEMEALNDFRDPAAVITLATNIKYMFEAGIIYHPSNFHLQNIYRQPNARVIAADGADMYSLSSISKGKEITGFWNGTWHLSPRDQQLIIIASSLNDMRFFSNWNNEKGTNWTRKDQENASHIFLETLVGHDNANKYITALTRKPEVKNDNVHKLQIELAALLLDRYRSPIWESTYKQLEQLRSKYNQRFEVSNMIDDFDLQILLDFQFGELVGKRVSSH